MRLYDAVIFDLDGLLIDSETVYMRAWREAASRVGFDMTLGFYQDIVGMPYQDCLSQAVAHFGPGFPTDRFVEVSNEIRAELLADGMKLKPGSVALLDYLASRDMPLAVASSSRREYVTGHLGTLEIDHYFSTIVTRSEVARGKPHPDPYLLAAEKIGADPKNCLALEDSRHGIQSALTAGMAVVMVPDLVPADAALTQSCVMIAGDLHAVRDWLAVAA